MISLEVAHLSTEIPQSPSHPGMAERAIDEARKPGKPLATVAAITREAPLASLFVAFLFGVAVARRR